MNIIEKIKASAISRKNPRGSNIWSYFSMVIPNRYHFDYVLHPVDGWEQYDTTEDASYFGIWINREARVIVSYAEGDISLTQSPTDEIFSVELQRLQAFYGNPPPYMLVIPRMGMAIAYHQKRP